MNGKRLLLILFCSFVMVFSSVATCFASETVEVVRPNNISSTYDGCVIFKSGVSYTCIVYKKGQGKPISSSSYLCVNKIGTDSAYSPYISRVDIDEYDPTGQNGGWGTMQTYSWGTSIQCKTILYSTDDVCDKDGNVVFPLTPPLKEVTEMALANFQTKTGGVMKILVVCGVGLIALLVGLNLFGKVFAIFQVR